MHRKLANLVIILLVTGSVAWFVWQGRFWWAAIPVAGVFLLYLFREPQIWWMVAVATMMSGLQLGVRRLTLHLTVTAGYCALCVAGMVMRRGPAAKAPPSAAPARYAALFLLIILLTAYIRGFGIRLLGSAMWGGTDYIVLVAAVSFYILSRRVLLSERQLWKTVCALCLLALLPAVIFFLGMAVPQIRHLGHILPTRAVIPGPEAIFGQAEGSRWWVLQTPGMWAGILALLVYERSYRMKPLVLWLAAAAIIMGGLSGHRTVPLILGLIFVIYYSVRRNELPMSQHIAFVIGGGVIVLLLFAFAPMFPITFQRAIAFLPGINVVEQAATSAAGTTRWRIDMWREMLPMIPDYWLIGRGLAFDLAEAYNVYISPTDTQGIWFTIATHSYHSGPLFLLIDLGLAGLLVAILFMVTGIVRYGRAIRELPSSTRLQSAFVVIYSYYVASCIFFFAVIGGPGSMARLMIIAAILEVMLNSSRHPRTRPEPGTSRRPAPPRSLTDGYARGFNPMPVFGVSRRMPRGRRR